jgi:hypothetical protein
MDAETKTCSKCGEVKPVDAFSIRNCVCKSCKSDNSKAYYHANREKCLAEQKAYKEQNRAKYLARSKSCYERNREKCLASQRAWKKANPEKILQSNRAWRKANPEKARACSKAWRDENPEKVRARQQAWRDENPEKVRASSKDRNKKLTYGYVKNLITVGTPIKEVPQSLIDLKRVQVQITRKLKEVKK